MKDLAGKVAVVTGGGSGIGRGIARALAREKAHVVVADIEVDAATSTAEELAGLGVKSFAVRCDVTDRESLVALADRAYSELGRVDVLCNNAGVSAPFGPLADASPRDLEWVFRVNTYGVFYGCSVFVPRMCEARQGGHILNTGSEHSLGIPFTGLGIYTASKHAVLAFSDILRRELEPEGIGVTILCPGVVRTEIWNAGRNRPDAFGGRVESPEVLRDFLAHGMDPDECGRLAVAAVKRGDFFALSHPEVRSIVEARCQELLAAFDAQSPRST
jgi:NAD(P)-dependent dehydrogenase (short-subunit alcohol dehydrogenase family)